MMLIRPFFYCGRAIRATSVASSYPSRKNQKHNLSSEERSSLNYKIVAQFCHFEGREKSH